MASKLSFLSLPLAVLVVVGLDLSVASSWPVLAAATAVVAVRSGAAAGGYAALLSAATFDALATWRGTGVSGAAAVGAMVGLLVVGLAAGSAGWGAQATAPSGDGVGTSMTGIWGGGPQAMAALEKPWATATVRTSSASSAGENRSAPGAAATADGSVTNASVTANDALSSDGSALDS